MFMGEFLRCEIAVSHPALENAIKGTMADVTRAIPGTHKTLVDSGRFSFLVFNKSPRSCPFYSSVLANCSISEEDIHVFNDNSGNKSRQILHGVFSVALFTADLVEAIFPQKYSEVKPGTSEINKGEQQVKIGIGIDSRILLMKLTAPDPMIGALSCASAVATVKNSCSSSGGLTAYQLWFVFDTS